jgi:hypothetical protein
MVERVSGLPDLTEPGFTEVVLGPFDAMWRRCSFMPSLDELDDEGRRPLKRKGMPG